MVDVDRLYSVMLITVLQPGFCGSYHDNIMVVIWSMTSSINCGVPEQRIMMPPLES